MALAYSKLDPVRPEIRLLRFVSYGDSDPISLEIRHAFLDDGPPAFGALSYVWGDATATGIIYVNEAPVTVRCNLLAALTQLRREPNDASEGIASQWLWVDSICIDQSNIAEKSRQVGFMSSIYRSADMVHIWLGPGTDRSDLAMDFICRFGPQALEAGILDAVIDPRKQGWLKRFEMSSKHRVSPSQDRASLEAMAIRERGVTKDLLGVFAQLERDKDFLDLRSQSAVRDLTPIAHGIIDLMSRDYWHRIWVVQEITVACKAVILCGTKSTALDVFDAALSTVNISRLRFKVGLGGTFYTSLPLQVRRCVVHGNVQPRLVDILWQYLAPPDRPFYAASDPRDLVFGTLGILSDTDRLRFQVDYRKTVTTVFAEATKALLESSNGQEEDYESCFGLVWCSPTTRSRATDEIHLPSWVCDWSTIGRHGFRVWPVSHGMNYTAAKGRISQTQGECEIEILRRVGCRVATVTEVMEPPQLHQSHEWSNEHLPDRAIPSWLSSIRNFMSLNTCSGPGEDYIWRTVQACDQGMIPAAHEEEKSLVRSIWREIPISGETLTPRQLQYVEKAGLECGNHGNESIQDTIDLLTKAIPSDAADCGRHRTLFKTNKFLLGLGHVTVQQGDLVVLIWGEPSPVILRPRENGGFTLVGDAYVDGIMHGEFLDSIVNEEIFSIY